MHVENAAEASGKAAKPLKAKVSSKGDIEIDGKGGKARATVVAPAGGAAEGNSGGAAAKDSQNAAAASDVQTDGQDSRDQLRSVPAANGAVQVAGGADGVAAAIAELGIGANEGGAANGGNGPLVANGGGDGNPHGGGGGGGGDDDDYDDDDDEEDEEDMNFMFYAHQLFLAVGSRMGLVCAVASADPRDTQRSCTALVAYALHPHVVCMLRVTPVHGGGRTALVPYMYSHGPIGHTAAFYVRHVYHEHGVLPCAFWPVTCVFLAVSPDPYMYCHGVRGAIPYGSRWGRTPMPM